MIILGKLYIKLWLQSSLAFDNNNGCCIFKTWSLQQNCLSLHAASVVFFFEPKVISLCIVVCSL